MSMLFYSSTNLTEEISAAKYPFVPSSSSPKCDTNEMCRLYATYQQRVGEFWPPITTLKAIWLTVTGQKAKVDDAVFGGKFAVKNKTQ